MAQAFYCKIFSQPIYIILHNTHININTDTDIEIYGYIDIEI